METHGDKEDEVDKKSGGWTEWKRTFGKMGTYELESNGTKSRRLVEDRRRGRRFIMDW